jgi:hypothetical protein
LLRNHRLKGNKESKQQSEEDKNYIQNAREFETLRRDVAYKRAFEILGRGWYFIKSQSGCT